MGCVFKILLMIIVSTRYTDGLLCPVGYKLMRDDTLVVDSENLTWSEAAIECSRMNGTIIKVVDNQSEQSAKDAMWKYSLDKAWIGYTGDIDETIDQSHLSEPYFIVENISDDQLKSSSYYNRWSEAKHAKFNSIYGWVPSKFTRLCHWVQVDLGKTMCIHGIVTQGRRNTDEWTTVYKLLYKKYGETFRTLWDNGNEELSGNKDRSTPVYRNFTKAFNAQFIRLYPQSWHGGRYLPAMRFDLLVSNNPCPTDFPCGKCPAMGTSTGGNLTIQYSSCCSKLPYICEIESCDQIQIESTSVTTITTVTSVTDLTVENTTSTVTTATDSNIENTTTICEDSPETHSRATGSVKSISSHSLTIGLIAGLVVFVFASFILTILLIISNRHQNSCKNPSKAESIYHSENNKTDSNQTVAVVTPNLHTKTEPKDIYARVDVKTKAPKPEVIYANTEIDQVGLYDIAEDVDVYNAVEETGDNSEVPDGIEMFKNEIYDDA
ncbi:unnamed protein product [Owenia fusiformis]|uniref:Uncharacterized protein n=1 Tax=Owenia fusiformis TaxID=6347 RepID=A0A8J1TUK0_OWEFU|nr:unnamed protein product [Owenia fusiformis]